MLRSTLWEVWPSLCASRTLKLKTVIWMNPNSPSQEARYVGENLAHHARLQTPGFSLLCSSHVASFPDRAMCQPLLFCSYPTNCPSPGAFFHSSHQSQWDFNRTGDGSPSCRALPSEHSAHAHRLLPAGFMATFAEISVFENKWLWLKEGSPYLFSHRPKAKLVAWQLWLFELKRPCQALGVNRLGNPRTKQSSGKIPGEDSMALTSLSPR